MTSLLLRSLMLLLIVVPTVASARWSRPESVPIERLIKNYSKILKENPKDAQVAYILARVHSLAFDRKTKTVALYKIDEDRYVFPIYHSLQYKLAPHPIGVGREEKQHLAESLRLYALAVKLDPDTPLHHLGLGWMNEQAAPWADQLGKIDGVVDRKITTKRWLERALSIYRSGYKRFLQQDLEHTGVMRGTQDGYVSQECAEGILRIVKTQSVGKFSDGEEQELGETIKNLKNKRRGITPIIFPVDKSASLADLVNPNARSSFDLVGDNVDREWPWIKPSAAFLVWDPKKTGVVKSGRQLFGSSTFWMFFQNGYEALASLDNDRDGWLRGKELEGISVWHDVDSDGISDPGEVLPLKRWKVVAVNVVSDGVEAGALLASIGIVYADGSIARTYDWEPVSRARRQ